MSLRDEIAALIWDHLRPEEDATPVADAILANPRIKAGLALLEVREAEDARS